MSDHRTTLFELKEKAKWSSDPEEKKAAIKELSMHGENAISELQEIMNITAYEDIKNISRTPVQKPSSQCEQVAKSKPMKLLPPTIAILEQMLLLSLKIKKKKKSKTTPKARERLESG